MRPTGAENRLPEADPQHNDALENAQELYERYLELSQITKLVPDQQDKTPSPPIPPPLDYGIHDTPIGIVIDPS